jgi:uncharacterized protein YdhG (YjbR/CyaY superfamily)
MPTSRKSTKTTPGFSDAEKAAMKERYLESKANKADPEGAVLRKIAEMPTADKAMATKLHEIIKIHAPMLSPKTWYGMPAYANKDGKIVCFFQTGAKFKYRYSTLGFQDAANLDEGNMWATSYALVKLTDVEEKKIIQLVKKAVK